MSLVPSGGIGVLVAQERDLDVVLARGRVLDPETGLDAVPDVGVRGGEIAAVSDTPLETRLRPGGTLADAAATGASLHIVHVNSSSLGDLPLVLDLIGSAQKHGVDVTTEAYPYTAASTSIDSAIFDEGWQHRLGISYGTSSGQDTGERLTEESFRKYRAKGGIVIIHLMKPELIDLAVRTPSVMIASAECPTLPERAPAPRERSHGSWGATCASARSWT